MRYVTGFAYGILAIVGLFALAIWLGAAHSGVAIFLGGVLEWLPLDRTVFLRELETAGIFSIGWGVGVTAWLVTGREAFRCLGERVPRAWILWRRAFLTSLVPVLKYTFGGFFMGALGIFLARHLWGLWTGAYDVGLAVGALVGAVHSFSQVREGGIRLEFLEANHRYLNDQKVPLFTETKKP